MQIQIYPNREIRIAVAKKKAPRRSDLRKSSERRERAAGPVPPEFALLDFPSELSQKTQGTTRKRHPLGVSARRKILRLGGVFGAARERKTVFLTGTLPGSTFEACKVFAGLTGYAVKLLQTYLCRRLSVDSFELAFLYVWELQKRGAPHLHVAVECPTAEKAEQLISEWRQLWTDILYLCQKQTRVDLFARRYGGTWRYQPEVWQCHAVPAWVGVERYLAKYLGKGDGGPEVFYPARWWGASRRIRSELDKFTAENSFYLPFRLLSFAPIETVKSLVLEAFGQFSPRGGTDVSPWFQDSTVSVFGFLRPDYSSFDAVELIISRIDEYLERKDGHMGKDKVMELETQIVASLAVVLSKLPSRVRRRLLLEYESALSVPLDRRTIITQEGFTHFGASLKRVCLEATGAKTKRWEWPMSALDTWSFVEKKYDSGQNKLTHLRR